MNAKTPLERVHIQDEPRVANKQISGKTIEATHKQYNNMQGCCIESCRGKDLEDKDEK